MTTTSKFGASVVLAIITTSAAFAQTSPPIRPLGPVVATAPEPLGSVSQVRALPGGRVIVNDNTGRRVMMFDSTLRNITVVADSTPGTANAYGSRVGGILAYRGDSTLFVDPTSLVMLLIDGNGKVVGTMATPQPNESNNLIGGPFGTPGFDVRGRLVHRAVLRPQVVRPQDSRAPTAGPDSSLIVRFDLDSRALDTVVRYGIPQLRSNVTNTERNGRTIMMVSAIVNPIPWTDDWALLSNGTIAIVRGRDYRVDFIDADDKLTSGPKLPFDWQRLSDDDKTAIIDSTRADMERQAAARTAQRAAAAGTTTAAPPTGPAPPALQFVAINEMPDYRPAFRQGSCRADADGNLWIRTSKVINGGAVYDVVNNKGALIDRVQVPAGRVIAGFGPGGAVYLGVVDGAITRLERARIH